MMEESKKEKIPSATPISFEESLEFKTNIYTKGVPNSKKQLKISTINIRGLNDTSKHNKLMDFIIRNNYDITVVTETNLSEENSKYFTSKFTNYKVFWAAASGRGSGIIVIAERTIAGFVHQTSQLEGRLLRIRLLMGAVKLNILAVYLPANPREKQQFHRKAQAWIDTCLENREELIAIGDWNIVPNYKKDRSTGRGNKNERIFFKHLKEIGLTDTIVGFRGMEPAYTWANKENSCSSRIDAAWVSCQILDKLVKASIVDEKSFLSTDHKAWAIEVELDSAAAKGKIKGKNKRYVYKTSNMDETKWKDYRETIDAELLPTDEEGSIETQWLQIKNSIKVAAEKHFLKVPLLDTRDKKYRPTATLQKLRAITILLRIAKTTGQDTWVSGTLETKGFTNKQIRMINQRIEKEEETKKRVPKISKITNKARWIENLEIWKREVSTAHRIEAKVEKANQINSAIEARIKKFESNKKATIASLLEKVPPKATFNIIQDPTRDNNLTADKGRIKEILEEAFWNMNKEEPWDQIYRYPRWWKTYRPINQSKDVNIVEPITIEELERVLASSAKGKAPGPSSITYEWIKNSSPGYKKTLVLLFNQCLQQGTIPKEWKQGLICPIVKKSVWDFDPNNLRPIILLETPRKLLNKIIYLRLCKILKEGNHLQQWNWAGSPGGSTYSPIKLLNYAIEEAKGKKKEMWILFQDISKAFNSVPKKGMELAMDRLGIPLPYKKLILVTMEDRSNKIKLGTEESGQIATERGLDQGDPLSPLLWKIFYDPLLARINKEGGSYRMHEEYRNNLSLKISKTISLEIPMLVYMDDTNWLAKNKDDLSRSLDIAEEFYLMHNIQVNSKKSKLVVLNKRDKSDRKSIKFMGNLIEEEDQNSAIRHLGTWLDGKGNKTPAVKKMEEATVIMQLALRKKKITIRMAKYLINNVLFPKLEYIMMDTIPQKTARSKLDIKIKSIIKSALRIPRSTPDHVIFGEDALGIFNLEWRLEKKTTRGLERDIRDQGPLGKATRIRLRELQTKTWSTKNVFTQDLNMGKNRYGWLANAITLLGKHKIKLKTPADIEHLLQTIGGNLEIISLIESKDQERAKNSLRNREIMFLEQIVELDKETLIPWENIAATGHKRGAGRIPEWFKQIKSLTADKRGRLKPLWKTQISQPCPAIPAMEGDKETSNWVLIKKKSNTILGRKKKMLRDGSRSFTHYKANEFSPAVHTCRSDCFRTTNEIDRPKVRAPCTFILNRGFRKVLHPKIGKITMKERALREGKKRARFIIKENLTNLWKTIDNLDNLKKERGENGSKGINNTPQLNSCKPSQKNTIIYPDKPEQILTSEIEWSWDESKLDEDIVMWMKDAQWALNETKWLLETQAKLRLPIPHWGLDWHESRSTIGKLIRNHLSDIEIKFLLTSQLDKGFRMEDERIVCKKCAEVQDEFKHNWSCKYTRDLTKKTMEDFNKELEKITNPDPKNPTASRSLVQLKKSNELERHKIIPLLAKGLIPRDWKPQLKRILQGKLNKEILQKITLAGIKASRSLWLIHLRKQKKASTADQDKKREERKAEGKNGKVKTNLGLNFEKTEKVEGIRRIVEHWLKGKTRGLGSRESLYYMDWESKV
jgi:exonuclease III